MKRIYLVLLLTLMAIVACAQNATMVGVVCPECGVYLKGDDAKHFDDPAYHKSGCTFVKKSENETSSGSTHLKDNKPLPEASSSERVLVYDVGNNGVKPCKHCLSVIHQPWCEVKKMQEMAKGYWSKAQSASSSSAREMALRDYHRMVDNLKIFVDPNFTKADLEEINRSIEKEERERREQRESQEAQRQAQAASPAPASYQHLSSVDIKNSFDKKLGFDSWATAYCKTFPNGEEQWVLYNQDGEEVGQFSKIETKAMSGGLDVFLVRNFNGKWGVYNAGGYPIVNPEYESVKVLVAQHQNQSREFYDVTVRDARGVLRHGLINSSIVSDDNQTIPCACDRIELIDRSPSNRGVLAKVTVNGNMGIMDVDSGDMLIQPGYSYVNTYFSPKGMYFIVGDGTQFGAYNAATMEVVVFPDTGKTLEQVRSIIDRRDR